MDGHNFQQLKAHILPLSHSNNFQSACTEWELESVEISDEFDHCPCGKEILEHCYIKNRITGHETYVGNVCIRRFMNFDTGTLFDGLKRIKENPRANANQAVIDYALKRGHLFGQKEYDFLTHTKKKRVLSPKQIAWKEKINRRILDDVQVSRRRK